MGHDKQGTFLIKRKLLQRWMCLGAGQFICTLFRRPFAILIDAWVHLQPQFTPKCWRKEEWNRWNRAAAGRKYDSLFPALPGNPGLMDCWWVVDVVADEWRTERTHCEVNSSALTCEELHYTSITSLTRWLFFNWCSQPILSSNNIIVANWTRDLIQSQPRIEIHHTVVTRFQQKFSSTFAAI